mmetsp:Transcript_2564/g.9858  ORF Transcript_2564/g.9858 Transcript_2564/m.9858 type:complete len:261 (-) Transcript_2564:2-784(-)
MLSARASRHLLREEHGVDHGGRADDAAHFERRGRRGGHVREAIHQDVPRPVDRVHRLLDVRFDPLHRLFLLLHQRRHPPEDVANFLHLSLDVGRRRRARRQIRLIRDELLLLEELILLRLGRTGRRAPRVVVVTAIRRSSRCGGVVLEHGHARAAPRRVVLPPQHLAPLVLPPHRVRAPPQHSLEHAARLLDLRLRLRLHRRAMPIALGAPGRGAWPMRREQVLLGRAERVRRGDEVLVRRVDERRDLARRIGKHGRPPN